MMNRPLKDKFYADLATAPDCWYTRLAWWLGTTMMNLLSIVGGRGIAYRYQRWQGKKRGWRD